MKIATFTDHLTTPSSRFRLRQYFSILESNGISVHDYYRKFSTQTAAPYNSDKRIRDSYLLICKALMHESVNVLNRFSDSISANQYDAVWLSRQLIIGYPSFEKLIRKPLIYDIDDAIYLTGDAAYLQFKISTERACEVIAGNDFLAEEALKFCKNVSVIPTAVDTQRWKPLDENITDTLARGAEFRIGWSGTSTSYKFFLPLEQEIKRFLIDYPSANLFFMADKFPNELKTLSPYIKFIQWCPENEVSFIQSLNVGLMPISDDMWSSGKCAYKMLLYASCGIPVVVTPTGVNKNILVQSDIGFGPHTPGEWYEALLLLFTDRSLGNRLGKNGVDLVRKDYSVQVCAPKIIEVLRRSV